MAKVENALSMRWLKAVVILKAPRVCAVREKPGVFGLQGDPCRPPMALFDTPASFFDQITYR
jgi:hypothetical protein